MEYELTDSDLEIIWRFCKNAWTTHDNERICLLYPDKYNSTPSICREKPCARKTYYRKHPEKIKFIDL